MDETILQIDAIRSSPVFMDREATDERTCRLISKTGNSIIADPNGDMPAEPLHKKEDILYADIDLKMLRGPK